MIEFNNTFHLSLFLSGFKFVLYVAKEDHGIIHPIKNKAPEAFIIGIGGYQLSMMDSEVLDMANGVLNFKFYLAEDIFEPQEIYHVLPR